MRYLTFCVLLVITAITIMGCGDSEQPLTPDTLNTDITISDRYFENSDLLYKPTPEQVEELMNLKYPADWYEEEDFELRAKYYYAMLLQRYGDIPAVHVEAQFYRLDLLSPGNPVEMSSDEIVLRFKAKYILWPTASNLSVLNRVQTSIDEDEILQNTDDPDVFVKILTKQYIEQYGDIPEVHIVVAGEKKLRFGGFRIATEADKDEYINYLRALYVLQPTEHNLCRLNAHIEAKENQTPFHLIELDCPETTTAEIVDIFLDDE